MKIEVKTADCDEDQTYQHTIGVKEGQSIVDAAIFAVEATALLYASQDLKYIVIHFEDED